MNWDAHFDLESKSEFGRDHLCRSLNKTPQCLHTHQSLIFVHCSCSLSLSNWNSALEKWNLGDMEGSDVSVLVLFSIIKPEISVSFLCLLFCWKQFAVFYESYQNWQCGYQQPDCKSSQADVWRLCLIWCLIHWPVTVLCLEQIISKVL